MRPGNPMNEGIIATEIIDNPAPQHDMDPCWEAVLIDESWLHVCKYILHACFVLRKFFIKHL